MKKACLSTLFVLFLFLSTDLSAKTHSTDPKERVEQIESRVHEIWKMDFTEMNKVEKVAIKEELKAIKKELKVSGLDDKVSISIGAIIIILLIIIIIA